MLFWGALPPMLDPLAQANWPLARFTGLHCTIYTTALNTIHLTAPHCITLQYIYNTGMLYTRVHCTVLHYTALYGTVLYCNALYCTVSHCNALYCTVLRCNELYCTVLHCNELYCTELHYTTLHCTVMYCSTLSVLSSLPHATTKELPALITTGGL